MPGGARVVDLIRTTHCIRRLGPVLLTAGLLLAAAAPTAAIPREVNILVREVTNTCSGAAGADCRTPVFQILDAAGDVVADADDVLGTLAGAAGPAVQAASEGASNACSAAHGQIAAAGVVSGGGAGGSPLENDVLKSHGCGALRDDAQRTVYDEVGEPPAHEACRFVSAVGTVCVATAPPECDVLVVAPTLGFLCVGGLAPASSSSAPP